MKIESVRSLKREIRERVLSPLIDDDVDRRRLGVRAFRQDGQPRPKTIALGISAENAGAGEYRLAVRVQHPLLWNSPEVKTICDAARNEVDIRYIGAVRPLQAPWFQEPCRPLRIGCSIGHFSITGGTLGAFVQDRTRGAIQILSNNHVLAAENQGKTGDAILQPGRFDHGLDPTSAVAKLTNFIAIDFSGVNVVDSAVANIVEAIDFDARSIGERGNLSGGRTMPLTGAEAVYKIGRTTGLTKGVLKSVEMDNVTVAYDRGSAIFDNQIEIEDSDSGPFAAGGDSGSLVFDENNLAIGLLFGGTLQGGRGNPGLAYANHLDSVLNQANADLLW